jgi:anti-anti-sigma regulatory factor
MVRNVDTPGPALQFTLPQQITLRTIPLLERQIDDTLAQRASSLEMLATPVQIVDSAGLNWLLTAKSRLEAANCALKIVDPSPLVVDAFTATRLDSRFTFVHTNGSAR